MASQTFYIGNLKISTTNLKFLKIRRVFESYAFFTKRGKFLQWTKQSEKL